MSFRVGNATLLFVLFLSAATILSTVETGRAQSGSVAQVLVRGNQRIEAETVRSYLQIQPGDPFSPSKIDDSLKALFRTGLFADVQIIRQGSNLVVQVEENPIINRVNFEGNSELTDEALLKEIELRPRTVFTRARVQSDVQRVVSLYRRSGHFTARVEPKIIRLPQNRVDLVFEIDEGDVTRIERINFIGNRAFSDSQLRSVVATAESRWWKILTASDNYDPDRLNFDRELLRRHYLEHGYADFRVLSATAELARDGESFFVTFTVDEGEQYRFGTITVDASQTSLDPSRLMAVVRTEEGDVYDATKVDKSVEQITLEAGKLGYAFAQVRPRAERDAENRTISITYEIQEGPRVYIERIDIVGNVRTLDRVIRREIRLSEGDAYNRVLVDRARRRITALDFFHKVEIDEQRGSAPDRVNLIVRVEEKSTGQLSFGAGYSTSEALIGSITLTERNLLGRGQMVRLQTAASFRRQLIDFSFTEPYFLGRRIQFGIDAFATETDFQDEASFDSRQAGAGVRFGFPLSENLSLITKTSFTHRDIKNIDSKASPVIRSAEGASNIPLVGFTLIYDTLDNPLSPTQGFRFTLDDEIAVGGDDQFWRVQAVATYFHTIWEGIVFMGRGTAGYVGSLVPDEKVSVLDRFFKGGDTFRGFARAGVGPRDVRNNDDAIGGQAYAIGTVELSFPLGLPEDFGIRGAIFSDFGTVFDAPEETRVGPGVAPGLRRRIKDTADLRLSAGASLLWDSPLGPLRFDFAYAVLKEDYDKTQIFHFSAGARF